MEIALGQIATYYNRKQLQAYKEVNGRDQENVITQKLYYLRRNNDANEMPIKSTSIINARTSAQPSVQMTKGETMTLRLQRKS